MPLNVTAIAPTSTLFLRSRSDPEAGHSTRIIIGSGNDLGDAGSTATTTTTRKEVGERSDRVAERSCRRRSMATTTSGDTRTTTDQENDRLYLRLAE